LNKTLTAQVLSAKKITLADAVNVCKAHGHNIYDMPDELPAELTDIKNIVTQILEKIH
jgi:hypothetical protein